jgi:HSP20 family molecular chaperone IbpA
MICRRCGKKAEKGWRYCPNCGLGVEHHSRSIFDDIFSRFRREFKDMDKMFDKDFEVLDLSPLIRNFQKPRGSGFSIKITRRGREQPKVDIQTFGNVDRNVVRKEAAEEMKALGIRPSVAGQSERQEKPVEKPQVFERPAPKPAKFTEEPKTQVRSIGTKVMVEMDLPEVKNESDIEVNDLESSVEVRARAGDKAYFKIITKPARFSVTSKHFEDGKLHLELS